MFFSFFSCFLDGREKFVREMLNSWSETSDATNKDKAVPIHFCKVDDCVQSSPSGETHSTHKSRKRRLSTEEEQSTAPVAKRLPLSVEDLHLLNSYWVETHSHGMFLQCCPLWGRWHWCAFRLDHLLLKTAALFLYISLHFFKHVQWMPNMDLWEIVLAYSHGCKNVHGLIH